MLIKKQKGFSLIELVAVIFIVSLGLVAMISLIVRVFKYSHLVSSKLEASYLAQEGIELVRNLRDSNWLEGSDWDQGIGTGFFEIDYNDLGLSSWQGEGRYLKITNGFYGYDDPGKEARFKRKIEIQKRTNIGDEPDEIQLSVKVLWEQNQKDYEIEVASRLYDWTKGFGLQ